MDPKADYQDTLRYLYERLPMFSKLGKEAIKKDLVNIRRLCEALGNPQDKFRSVHIAGTNGKGSTSHMLAAVMQEAGYKTGLYTSPHLVDFRERIRIDGQPVAETWVVDFVREHKELIETIQPSFFEVTVVMAFQAFAEAGVAVAIIETGVGGRLDSTNIIRPVLSIITNISYDHKDLLGNTLREIAAEKAGIIKERVPVLVGEQQEEISRVFFEAAVLKQSTVYYAQALWDLVSLGQEGRFHHFKAIQTAQMQMYDLRTDLLGKYQLHNIRTVLAATGILEASSGFELPVDKRLAALSRVGELTGLRGRWERLSQQPLVIADVAHNPAGLQFVMEQWGQVAAATKHVIVGFVKDKEVEDALRLLDRDGLYYFTNADAPRALPAAELRQKAAAAGLEGKDYPTVRLALQAAMEQMQPSDALLVTGSFFIVGEVIEYFAQLRTPQPAVL